MVTQDMNASDSVRGLIEQLAAISTKDASNALEALASDRDLRPWHSHLADSTHRQNALCREAGFVHGDVAQVLDTLSCGAPANAADLAALTLEHLHQVAGNIRDGNTSDWRQYWNVDQYCRPLNPRPENTCRDALLSDLKNRLLPLGVDVQGEGSYADGKRADIRVSFPRFNVPIEIKRSNHRDLWSAIRSQLIARYVRDPGTGGHGIYVVFWFGEREGHRPAPPGAGPIPTSPAELESLLRNTLSHEEQFRIRICVIDVSVPSSDVAAPANPL